MRAKKGEIITFVAIITSLFLYGTLSHWTGLEHKMTVAKSQESWKDQQETSQSDQRLEEVSNVAFQLSELMQQSDVSLNDWVVVWRGTLDQDAYHQVLRQLEHHSSFTFKEQPTSISHRQNILQKVWEKESNGTVHQIQLLVYPQKRQTKAKFIYTWSGSDFNQLWTKESERLKDFLESLPLDLELFLTINAITVEQNTFDQWITALQAKKIQVVADTNFFSLTGYVPTWEQHVQVSGNQKMNVQLSARRNELKEVTYVTIGYPLILQEH